MGEEESGCKSWEGHLWGEWINTGDRGKQGGRNCDEGDKKAAF